MHGPQALLDFMSATRAHDPESKIFVAAAAVAAVADIAAVAAALAVFHSDLGMHGKSCFLFGRNQQKP